MNTTKTAAKKSRGRPALQPGEQTVVVPVRMTSPQRDKLIRLGGAEWVRSRIDRAREPQE
jgi:hypothetical protein